MQALGEISFIDYNYIHLKLRYMGESRMALWALRFFPYCFGIVILGSIGAIYCFNEE